MSVKPGLTFTETGAEFAVYSESGAQAFLCLFDDAGAQETSRVKLEADGSGWHRAGAAWLQGGRALWRAHRRPPRAVARPALRCLQAARRPLRLAHRPALQARAGIVRVRRRHRRDRAQMRGVEGGRRRTRPGAYSVAGHDPLRAQHQRLLAPARRHRAGSARTVRRARRPEGDRPLPRARRHLDRADAGRSLRRRAPPPAAGPVQRVGLQFGSVRLPRSAACARRLGGDQERVRRASRRGPRSHPRRGRQPRRRERRVRSDPVAARARQRALSAGSTRTIRSATSTTWAAAIASRSTARPSSRW